MNIKMTKIKKTFGWITFFAMVFILIVFNQSCNSSKASSDIQSSSGNKNSLHLTVFYPSLGSLKVIIGLQEHGLLPKENLQVNGYYHQLEKTNYLPSIRYIEKNNIDWITLHELNQEINKDNLFSINPLTDIFKSIFDKSDGIIFFGGADIPPYIYEKNTNLLTKIDTPKRSFLETSFVFHLLGGFQNQDYQPLLDTKPNFPILGLCLGLQSLNVGTGGTLVQDIWSEIYGVTSVEEVIKLEYEQWHTNPYSRIYPELKLFPNSIHPIHLTSGSVFTEKIGMNKSDTPLVYSAHHQMAGKIGKGFQVAATSLDGKVIEAISHKQFPNVLGVQFHPESTRIWNPTKKYKFLPDDQIERSLRTLIMEAPPSLEFHRKLWEWFSKALKDNKKK